VTSKGSVKKENFIMRKECPERNFIFWKVKIVEKRSIVRAGHKCQPKVPL
jgi:hypothetical protein